MLNKSFHRLFISSFILFGRPGAARRRYVTRLAVRSALRRPFIRRRSVERLYRRLGLALRATAPHRWRGKVFPLFLPLFF
jgi:hypothetical protein